MDDLEGHAMQEFEDSMFCLRFSEKWRRKKNGFVLVVLALLGSLFSTPSARLFFWCKMNWVFQIQECIRCGLSVKMENYNCMSFGWSIWRLPIILTCKMVFLEIYNPTYMIS